MIAGRGISACSVMDWDSDIVECVDAWSRAGIPAIGVTLPQVDRAGRERAVAALRASGLGVSSLQGLRPYRLRGDVGTSDADLLANLDLAAEIGAECVMAMTGPRGDLAWDDAMARVVEQTVALLPELHARDLRLAIEPVGPMRQDLTFVNLATDAVEIVDRVDDSAFGYVFDVYHLWWQRGIEAVARDTADRVFLVQVSDHKPVTVRAMDRALPGGGVMPLHRLLHALADGGYRGWWELEVVGDDHAEGGIDALLRGAQCAVDRTWEAA